MADKVDKQPKLDSRIDGNDTRKNRRNRQASKNGDMAAGGPPRISLLANVGGAPVLKGAVTCDSSTGELVIPFDPKPSADSTVDSITTILNGTQTQTPTDNPTTLRHRYNSASNGTLTIQCTYSLKAPVVLSTTAAITACTATATQSPVEWWKFTTADYNAGAGTSVADPVGGNRADFSGSPTWSTDAPWANGFSLFINNNGALALIHPTIDPRNDFTIFWRARLLNDGTQRIFTSGDVTGDSGFRIRCGNASSCELYFFQNNSVASVTFASALNNWHSFCWSVTSGSAQFYLDGDPVGSPTTVNQGTNPDTSLYFWGRHPAVVSTIANLTDLRVFSVGLSDPEVANVHGNVGPF